MSKRDAGVSEVGPARSSAFRKMACGPAPRVRHTPRARPSLRAPSTAAEAADIHESRGGVGSRARALETRSDVVAATRRQAHDGADYADSASSLGAVLRNARAQAAGGPSTASLLYQHKLPSLAGVASGPRDASKSGSLPIARTEPPCFCNVGGFIAGRDFPLSRGSDDGGANIAVGDAAASCELMAAFAARTPEQFAEDEKANQHRKADPRCTAPLHGGPEAAPISIQL
jgi:hypothetical protein